MRAHATELLGDTERCIREVVSLVEVRGGTYLASFVRDVMHRTYPAAYAFVLAEESAEQLLDRLLAMPDDLSRPLEFFRGVDLLTLGILGQTIERRLTMIEDGSKLRRIARLVRRRRKALDADAPEEGGEPTERA